MMNLNLNYEGFEDYLLLRREFDGPFELIEGVQYRFRFENNYGASVVKRTCTYGYRQDLWELAVLYFEDDDDNYGHLTYNTPITDDVIGFLTDENVRELLGEIKGLPK